MVIIFNTVRSFIDSVISFFTGIGNLIYTLVQLLSKCFSFLFDLIGALPTAFTVSLVALVAIAIIYKLLGREAGN